MYFVFVFALLFTSHSFAGESCHEALCPGERVVYSNYNNDTGKVIEVFSNGKASIDWDNYTSHSIVRTSDLSGRTNCQGEICVSSRVVYSNSNNDTGRVIEVFSNGKAVIDWDNYTRNSVVSTSDLHSGYRCVGNLCVGDRVVYNNYNNDTGNILEVFSNGTAMVDWDNYTKSSIVRITDLGYELGDCRN